MSGEHVQENEEPELSSLIRVSGAKAAVFLQKCRVRGFSGNLLLAGDVSNVYMADCDIEAKSCIEFGELDNITIKNVQFTNYLCDKIPYLWWKIWYQFFKYNGINEDTIACFDRRHESFAHANELFLCVKYFVDNCKTLREFRQQIRALRSQRVES